VSGLSVLSIGYTREMWDPAGDNDTQNRLKYYAQNLDRYWLVTNAYRRHGLSARRMDNIELLPTNGWTPVDSFVRMLLMGHRILGAGKVSVIQAQDPILTGFAGLLLGCLYRVPVNVCVYGPNVFDEYWIRAHWSHRILAPVGRWVLRRASGIQVDGRLTATRLRRALGANARIFVKPVRPQHFDALLALEPQQRRDAAVFRLLFLGRLEAQKNLPMLAAVFERARTRLAEHGITLMLDVFGDGAERRDMERRLAGSVRAGTVAFHGQVSANIIAKALERADTLVLTSYYEGYPRVLMEAAAAAVPIVSTAISGADEAILEGETGFITPIGDVEAFAAKIVTLARDPARRADMGRRGREHIREALAASKGHAAMQIDFWRQLAEAAGK
jgi:glycosyltransferase involved in cell wall biosynthesis